MQSALLSKNAIKKSHADFVDTVMVEILNREKHNKRSIEKLAASFSIFDKTEVKELTELAIVQCARNLAHQANKTTKQKFDEIVELYKNQVNLSHRTSQSILLQQYSTPAPIGYLMGVFCDLPYLHQTGGYAFEPSAGNGLLTIAAKPERVYVNEIDTTRNRNLQTQGYAHVSKDDATNAFSYHHSVGSYSAVLTNPPFGTAPHITEFDGYPIGTLEHLMAIRALETMASQGKAAIIIGGHTRHDEKGRIQKGAQRIFFNYVYAHYHVIDVIPINGSKLYSRQGTSFDTRLILISGRKETPQGVAPVYDKDRDTEVSDFESLYERVMDAMRVSQLKNDMNTTSLKNAFANIEKELEAELKRLQNNEDLGAPYQPASESCVVLNTVVPDSMEFETKQALDLIQAEVGGSIDEFVKQRLAYPSKLDLCKALSAEQTDAVAMAIYNIEAREQGMIIGDQTGIGKGRVAAAMIRYAVLQGHKPIFITEKPNLFSDIYRDLIAIGSGHLVPFIVNGKESKTDIKDENGTILYQALPSTEQQHYFKDKRIPANCDFVLATYSQFNSPDRKPEKPQFLLEVAKENVLILDESHNASGSSQVGDFLQGVLFNSKGVVFLSATFAKRPDNMPIYAMKTAISDANMTKEELVTAILKGGVALQEVLASQLVKEGQMLRRERSFEGVEVNYLSLDELETEHKAIADNITDILRDIITFQSNSVDDMVEELDEIAVAEGKEVTLREGTSQAGVDNLPYFSKVFQVINQMLFSIKASAVADRAILRLKEGKKPVVAFASTMGSFIEQMENDKGLPVSDGDTINADFTEVLMKGLDGILRYTVTTPEGKKEFKKFLVSELPETARLEYLRISDKIKNMSSGISISPIDIIVQKLTSAGYRVAEVTGRKYEVQINTKNNQGLVKTRTKINTNDAFRQFNNNEVDVLLINQSGSTGASAHAITTKKVSASEMKQRVMIVLQAELDINTEVQKRGRINRTGQILSPIYDYVMSAIPAEKRLMMMLQKKLKSLDANTTSNQKQSTKILDVPDFLNKYGDKIVAQYLADNTEINLLLGDPLGLLDTSNDNGEVLEDAAHRVSGRVAVLSTKMQVEFYNEIAQSYSDFVDYLKQIGEYDLEVEAMNLEAKTISQKVIRMGKGGDSEFGADSILEKIEANVLRKPFSKIELENIIKESLGNSDPKHIQKIILDDFDLFTEEQLKKSIQENEAYYLEQIHDIPTEKKGIKIQEKEGEQAYQHYLKGREKELKEAEQKQLVKIQELSKNRKQYLNSIFKFFYVGRNINYPINTFADDDIKVKSVFLGFIIDKKKKNPYAPSNVRLRFALANSNKYIAMPASYTKDINSIIGVSHDLEQNGLSDTLENWELAIKETTKNRTMRYVITGNILQAFAHFNGKLVSYTTTTNEIKKGILMPEYWESLEELSNQVTVPIGRAYKVIASTVKGNGITTVNGTSIFNQGDTYKIVAPASKQRGGDVFLDADILKLVERHNFDKTADKMVALIKHHHLKDLLNIMQIKFNDALTISMNQFSLIKNETSEHKERHKIKLLSPEESEEQENLFLLALSVEVELELELELMKLQQAA